MAVPLTIILAPLQAHCCTLLEPTPPSTSMFNKGNLSLRNFTFESISDMKGWPPFDSILDNLRKNKNAATRYQYSSKHVAFYKLFEIN